VQLRGRVGRADREAHAYMFHPRKELLSDDALERLVALEECCGLGQGFQLAERDMAIRGIGSVFGEKQSGDVGKVGVDLYLEMLFEGLKKVLHSLIFDLSLFHVEVVPMCVELSAMQPDKEKSMKLYGVKLQLWNACP
jgi:transcription-repair coupling factor (superfamily II helicase)